MSGLKKLIHEAHRRSLWQVLGIYLAVSWVVIQVVETLTESAGLPDWVPPFALVLLLIGLPIVMATAFVQEGIGGGGPETSPGPSVPEGRSDGSPADVGSRGTAPTEPPVNLAAGTGSLDRPSTRPSTLARLLTWRNAIVGGVVAFAALGVLVVSYWVMWATGVGPVGSLVAQGVLEEAEPVILAEFENATDDPLMGDLVTSTLRIDLVESPVITIAEPLFLEQVLQRMGRDPSEPVTPDVAREIAVREGLKAVIEGEVRSAGSEYLLTATIRGAAGGRSLAAFRVVAENEGEIVEALDELSQDIRERAGESLRSIRADAPLESVTTSSLEALRKFTEAERLTEQGDPMAALTLLEDAVELDPEFAMAYRRIAVIYSNNNLDPEAMIDAAAKAYELSSRLADRERYLAEAFYHSEVRGDREATIQAYRTVLRSHPDDAAALNNLANEYVGLDDDAAIELYRRAVNGPGESNISHDNLARNLIRLQRFEEAEQALTRYEKRYPEDHRATATRFWLHFFRGEFETADSVALALAGNPRASAFWRTRAHRRLAATDLFHGRARAAERHMVEATRTAEESGPTAEWFEAWRVPFMRIQFEMDDGRGMGLFDDLTDLFQRVPPVARPYLILAAVSASYGEIERARGYVQAWESNVPIDYRTDDDRALKTIVDGLVTWQSGDPAAGLDLVDQGRRELGCVTCWQLERALIIESMGTPDEAIAAWEARANSIDGFFFVNAVELPEAYERLCHLHAEHGETTRAVEYCSRFVELWSDADPELQPRVRAVQQRLDAVSSG